MSIIHCSLRTCGRRDVAAGTQTCIWRIISRNRHIFEIKIELFIPGLNLASLNNFSWHLGSTTKRLIYNTRIKTNALKKSLWDRLLVLSSHPVFHRFRQYVYQLFRKYYFLPQKIIADNIVTDGHRINWQIFDVLQICLEPIDPPITNYVFIFRRVGDTVSNLQDLRFCELNKCVL